MGHTLNKKESERFIKKMIETEKRELTEKEKEIIREVDRMFPNNPDFYQWSDRNKGNEAIDLVRKKGQEAYEKGKARAIKDAIEIVDKMINEQMIEFERCKGLKTTRMRNANSKNWGMVKAEYKLEDFNEVKQQLQELYSQQTKPNTRGLSDEDRVFSQCDSFEGAITNGGVKDQQPSSRRSEDKTADTFSKIVKEANRRDIILFDEANGEVKNLTKPKKVGNEHDIS